MRELNPSVEFANKTGLVYSAVCKPLCQKLHLPQTAFDILMILANNPNYTTARDIVEVRHIKANLVSVNVDKLVQEGFLERRAVLGDRRKKQRQDTVQPYEAADGAPKSVENADDTDKHLDA